MNIIIHLNIKFNAFLKEYEKKYFKGICKMSIRKELNIPKSDKLKKNGAFERGLFYIVENNLNYADSKQKLFTSFATTSGDVTITMSEPPKCLKKLECNENSLLLF
ncbi:hypothetical protein LL036_02515 [Clostridium sp. CF011]|uniref:hypothetical protein n=2 Tax=Clostridium sp. CF011 TaxID=2843318 RepID=UPI00227AB41C|nr:hypothetical protein [Clostridium sp. CF011]WAG70338.1 hypothetical protein LL036_02515 [Clostridium sp. CF011]